MLLINNDLLVVLTVGSFSQKKLCEKLISQLDLSVNNIAVLCDAQLGARVGSGGALLSAVKHYYDDYRKMIIINCGGFSKRTVNCAVKGKAFAQTLTSDKPVTLLEHILNSALALSTHLSEGILITCSDILVDLRDVDFDFTESTVFGISTDLSIASQHGSMVKDENNELLHFFQKLPVAQLRPFAFSGSEQIIVDTGIAYINDSFVQRLRGLIYDGRILDFIKDNKTELNFYSDILPLLSKSVRRCDYIGDGENHTAVKMKNMLYDYLADCTFKVCTVEGQPFMHFGSSEQLRDNTLKVSDKAQPYLKINSFVSSESRVGRDTVLDNVCLLGEADIGVGCLISDIRFNLPVAIADNSSVCGFKLSDGSFVAVITDIKENPKALVDGSELWDVPRFYKARSFDESLAKFNECADEEKVSLAFCAEHADVDYFSENKQYISDLTESRVHVQYTHLRSKIIDQHFKGRAFPTRFSPKCDCVEISMPIRLNLSGTWTDAMPYCIENGGAVINAAATTDGILPIKVKLEKLNEKAIEFYGDGIKTVFSFDDVIYENDFSDFNLHKAVLKTVGITGMEQLENGFRLSTEVKKIDKGSGLGTSSILLAACMKAFSQMYNLGYTESDIIGLVFVAEQIMKTGGGWQDQAGGLSGGIKLISSQAGLEQQVKVKNIELPESIKAVFEHKAVLMPTGQRHFGRFIVNDVANRYLNRNPDTLSAFEKMQKLNADMYESIRCGDVKRFYECINLHRQLLGLISPLTVNSKIDAIVRKCMRVADAVSVCGAGGGGYLLVLLKDDISVEDFRAFACDEFPEIKSEVLKTDIFYQADEG